MIIYFYIWLALLNVLLFRVNILSFSKVKVIFSSEFFLFFHFIDSIFSPEYVSRVTSDKCKYNLLGRSADTSVPPSPSVSPSHQASPCDTTVLLLVVHGGSVLDSTGGTLSSLRVYLFYIFIYISMTLVCPIRIHKSVKLSHKY